MKFPEDQDAEKAVLGAMLVDPRCIDEVRGALTIRSFALPQHSLIFQALLDHYDSGRPVDLVLFADRLRRYEEGRDCLAEVGGNEYLIELGESWADTANAPYYAGIVAETFRLRELIRAGEGLQLAAQSTLAQSSDVLRAHLAELDEVALGAHQNRSADLGAILDALPTHLTSEGRASLRTPLIAYNEQFGGLDLGSYTLLAGRPSTGKTALAISCLLGSGVPGVMFSLEMRREHIGMRVLSTISQVPLTKIRRDSSPDDLRLICRSAQATLQAPIWVYDDCVQLRDIIHSARHLVARSGVRLIVVDYVQLVRPAPGAHNREREVGSISNALKQLAQSDGVAVLGLSQLNRDMEKTNRRATLADLRDSGSLEQDADVVWLLWCPEAEKEKSQATVCLRVAKNRNGPLGEFNLLFDKPRMSWRLAPVEAVG